MQKDSKNCSFEVSEKDDPNLMFNWDDWNTDAILRSAFAWFAFLICVPSACRVRKGESLVGGIDVKMAFHRGGMPVTIVQHSILCLLPIRKFRELILIQ